MGREKENEYIAVSQKCIFSAFTFIQLSRFLQEAKVIRREIRCIQFHLNLLFENIFLYKIDFMFDQTSQKNLKIKNWQNLLSFKNISASSNAKYLSFIAAFLCKTIYCRAVPCSVDCCLMLSTEIFCCDGRRGITAASCDRHLSYFVERHFVFQL